jgi:fructose-1,6-bisphosphatase-3
LDLFWYLWSGPQSLLFGKDRITTFERDLVADPRTHHETKNPYFRLIHEAWFCDEILTEFGVDPAQGMIVNGHVPVRWKRVSRPSRRAAKPLRLTVRSPKLIAITVSPWCWNRSARYRHRSQVRIRAGRY